MDGRRESKELSVVLLSVHVRVNLPRLCCNVYMLLTASLLKAKGSILWEAILLVVRSLEGLHVCERERERVG